MFFSGSEKLMNIATRKCEYRTRYAVAHSSLSWVETKDEQRNEIAEMSARIEQLVSSAYQ